MSERAKMPTINQLVRKGRKKRVFKSASPAFGCGVRSGGVFALVCTPRRAQEAELGAS